MVVASGVVDLGRTSVRVPAGAECEVWALLAVDRPVVAIVVVFHESYQNMPSLEQEFLV